MQPTTAALGDAPQAPRRFELATFRLGAERDTDYATEPPPNNNNNNNNNKNNNNNNNINKNNNNNNKIYFSYDWPNVI